MNCNAHTAAITHPSERPHTVIVHTTHMQPGIIALSPMQRDTIALLREHGMEPEVAGQDPYSMALIAEVFQYHPYRFPPLFTIIAADGMTYCPYN